MLKSRIILGVHIWRIEARENLLQAFGNLGQDALVAWLGADFAGSVGEASGEQSTYLGRFVRRQKNGLAKIGGS